LSRLLKGKIKPLTIFNVNVNESRREVLIFVKRRLKKYFLKDMGMWYGLL